MLSRVRERAFAPLFIRFDALAANDQHLAEIHGQLSARIDELSLRIKSLELTLETMEGRTATVTERQYDYEEDRFRLTRRLDEIEKLLAEGQQ